MYIQVCNGQNKEMVSPSGARLVLDWRRHLALGSTLQHRRCTSRTQSIFVYGGKYPVNELDFSGPQRWCLAGLGCYVGLFPVFRSGFSRICKKERNALDRIMRSRTRQNTYALITMAFRGMTTALVNIHMCST
jgi:hypothetical protein